MDEVELNYVKEFFVLSKTDSYYSAAAELYISPSTLSKHIRSLEDELGVNLFDHSKRTVQLTDYGKCFCKYAEKLSDMQEDYMSEFDRIRADQTRLVIGAIPPQVEYDITSVIDLFEAQHPAGKVKIVEGNSTKLFTMLQKDSLKMIFTENRDYSFNEEGEYEIIRFFSDEMCVILPVSHPLAMRESIAIGKLAKEQFVSWSPEKSNAYDFFVNICRKAGFEPNIVYIAYRVNEMMDLVARGKGIAITKKKPALYYQRLYPSLRMIDCNPEIPVNIDFMYKKTHVLTETEKLFVDCVRQGHGRPVTAGNQ